jgi:hypothetical protein
MWFKINKTWWKWIRCKFKQREVHLEWHPILIKILSSKQIKVKTWRWTVRAILAETIKATIAARAKWERKVFIIKSKLSKIAV